MTKLKIFIYKFNALSYHSTKRRAVFMKMLLKGFNLKIISKNKQEDLRVIGLFTCNIQ